ncbi:enterochelin ABC transporter substrate-binding protein [Campylobacter novaezeelandiae]|uniref:Enterochelin ABC transporter substrate-binding protein n=1 Tax=Campylobacter novaezeelandiae TaxID=2267891 RepID=A0A4Q9JVZ5_9BACT|nr:siderophore ABC transporter substrate-binding protein [Campylobacter novaezeelandiae]TBR81643.1 enterochelin ABC transporter substrate-binding protein [Campylobacter novaezeelandiae]TBR82387.1 enterochelin ABC transporter substrate-binding protein [Campylobacter novaezeelandiae]
MKKKSFLVWFCLFLLLGFSACFDNKIKNNSENTLVVTPISVTDKGDSFLIKHSLGESRVVKNPSRVVILDFGSLDTFDSLNLSDKVIGVPLKNLPPYLKQYDNKSNIGGVQQVNLEAINALKPDLIIISGRQTRFYDKLNQIAPTIYLGINNSDFLFSFENNVLSIAKLYNKESEAKEKISQIKEEISEIKSKISKDKKALIILTNSNKISAFGSSSRFGLIHDILDIEPVDKSLKVGTHGKSINSEYILEKNPDFIFVIDRNVIVGNQEKAKDILNNALILKTKAAQNNKIIYLDPQYWYLSGGGLESLEAMIKEVAKALN